MGCVQSQDSTAKQSDPTPPNGRATQLPQDARKHKKGAASNNAASGSPAPPITRKRTDSWANHTGAHVNAPPVAMAMTPPPPPASPSSTDAAPPTVVTHGTPKPTPRSPVEAQWKLLWDLHSANIVDPVDVPAVLDSLLNRTINRLSTTQITLLQRKVRSVVRTLQYQPPSQNKIVKVFSGSVISSNAANSQQTVAEAKGLIDRHRLLSESVVQRILPPTPLLSNCFTLLLYLSADQWLWDRVRLAAQAAADAAGLDMDVNHQITANKKWTMPKPSIVPEIIEPPEWPVVGVSLQALAALIALGLAGSRSKQLHLLFYLLMPDLAAFLSKHPAGGVPTWLLEDEETIVSLPSLTHYHYYGTALFLEAPKHTFAASTSRKPVSIDSKSTLEILSSLLMIPKTATATATASSPAGSNMTTVTANDTKLVSRRNSKVNLPVEGGAIEVSLSGLATPTMDGQVQRQNRQFSSEPKTELMLRLGQSNADAPSALSSLDPLANVVVIPADWEASQRKFLTAMAMVQGTSEKWTLDDFAAWAVAALDDTAMEIIVYRIFGSGILPSPAIERDLVHVKWEEWCRATEASYFPATAAASSTAVDSNGSLPLHDMPESNGSENAVKQNGPDSPRATKAVPDVNQIPYWGGFGGIDNSGGLGHGLIYCIDTQWWERWCAYVGWRGSDDEPVKLRSFIQPGEISNERLLDRSGQNQVPGTLGSYELMKQGLHKGKDYVMVPPGVWDVLYEMYAGGPPLPRMLKSVEQQYSDDNRDLSVVEASDANSAEMDCSTEVDRIVGSANGNRVLRIPDSVSAVIHPWVIQCQLCDPLQPYKRGDTGSLSIRVQATPDQPLWRLFAEIVCRFPLHAYKSYDYEGLSKARLWRRTEPAGPKDPATRYGPWNLLCKSRHAVVPMINGNNKIESGESTKDMMENWKMYTDGATVESIGLTDMDNLMLEFAVQNKNGDLMWPREAAAKAGRVRRLAQEDAEFRRMLLGVDKDNNMLFRPPKLVGMEIDAMDSSGRWYSVTVLEVEIVDETEGEMEQEEDGETPANTSTPGQSSKKLKVDFTPHNGHVEWIDVESDRLAKLGRFTSEADQQTAAPSPMKGSVNSSQSNDQKAKPTALVKKNSSGDNPFETAKLCTLPGFGACGLTNMGNTCYMNSALQCISYMPLLRAYLLSGQYKTTGDMNRDNPLGTNGRLLEECSELLRNMWSGRLGEKTPSKFRTQLGKINSLFSGADQQDAQEFLNYILDVLHEDSNKVRKKPVIEALEDDWVKATMLSRVGEEAWRRFLRRNRSIMTDVAMGQVLNTVTCPICNYSSRNFDPFNLLSIPVPTVADVIFQCTVYRRATALNCPWVLNRTPKGSTRPFRFSRKNPSNTSGPPSEAHVAEEYVIAMSRLSDSSELRGQIQKLCGIPANRLRLCRAEEVVVNEHVKESYPVRTQIRVMALTDKEGPCSQLAKKRLGNDDGPVPPTHIIAFESTLLTREEKADEAPDDTGDEEEEDASEDRIMPTSKERILIEKSLSQYGNEKECRLFDTDPVLLAKAVSRSLWPRSQAELRVGLRVDAKDHRGNWFSGSVIEIIEEDAKGTDSDTGEEVAVKKRKARVHFDHFSSKWDESYSIEHFDSGRVRPLYSHSSPKAKPTEFNVHHRHTYRDSGDDIYFGQSFFVQCHTDWSNARAGAHILAQASRFLHYRSVADSADEASLEKEAKAQRVFEKAQMAISQLIDLLIECDREYIRMALGVSEHNGEAEKAQPYRNPLFDASSLSVSLMKKASDLLQCLPFEIRVVGIDPMQPEKAPPSHDDEPFPFSLLRTVGNYLYTRNAVVLHWHKPSRERKGFSESLRVHVIYAPPAIHIHEASAEILKASARNSRENSKKSRPGGVGIDLGECLTEFCKQQKLSVEDNWRCPRCKDFREGKQDMSVWRLPDLLTFHIKRFNMSARWREKIVTKVNFPLTGLDMSEWCHAESPAIKTDGGGYCVYDLIGVMNHYGSMTGGHYVAVCKATSCFRDGREEVAYSFNGVGVAKIETEDSEAPAGWRLGRGKSEVSQNKLTAVVFAKAVSDSAEPTWLQFDDELVEPIAPGHIVAENAYVLFYRKRRMTPSNVARYSTLE